MFYTKIPSDSSCSPRSEKKGSTDFRDSYSDFSVDYSFIKGRLQISFGLFSHLLLQLDITMTQTTETILITGAGGWLGSLLPSTLLKLEPKKVFNL